MDDTAERHHEKLKVSRAETLEKSKVSVADIRNACIVFVLGTQRVPSCSVDGIQEQQAQQQREGYYRGIVFFLLAKESIYN